MYKKPTKTNLVEAKNQTKIREHQYGLLMSATIKGVEFMP